MIVQAIGLLDDLDQEINIYAMRVREWYGKILIDQSCVQGLPTRALLGWHFPEMAKIVNDNMFFAKCVLRMGMRINCKSCDFSDILADEGVEEALKKSAETSVTLSCLSFFDAMNHPCPV